MTPTKTRRPVWTRGTVTVAVHETRWTSRRKEKIGTEVVEADLWGPFAVHERLGPWVGEWTVTHVPTGWATLTGARSKAAAKAWCKEVAPLWDWAALTADDGIQVMPAEIQTRVLAAVWRARP